MKRILSHAAAAAALLPLAATPALAAQTAPAAKLSLTRAATQGEHESNITSPPIIAVIGLLAIVGGAIYIAVDDDDPDSP